MLLGAVLMHAFATHSEEVKFPIEMMEAGEGAGVKEMRKILSRTLVADSKELEASKDDSGRLEKVGKAAFEWGIKEAQYFYLTQYKSEIEKYDSKLSIIANFSQFIVDGKMLLPKIALSERLFEKVNDHNIREVGFSITIFEPARLVGQPPTWRDYLPLSVAEPLKPSAIFLPRTDTEEYTFKYEFERGWWLGRKQAEVVLDEGFKRLIRDIEFHYNFLDLAMTNVLRMPSVASSDPGVVVSADGKTLYGNDVIYTIDKKSTFEQLDKWKPMFIEHRQ